ncbi:MAG: hypothetical protein ACFFAA_11505 [Promethearchaeota archaeon]
MKRRRNHNLIKFERSLVLLLTITIIIFNLVPLIFTRTSFFQKITLIEDIKCPKTSESEGGGYIMNYSAFYSWIEISTSGTLMNISNENDGYDTIHFNTEGWNFTYYETEYNTIYISSNGWMSFTDLGSTQLMCSPIPDLSSENIDCVALLCTDLNPVNGGEIYYEFFSAAPYKYLVIEYHNVFSNDNNYIGSFQVIFNQSGVIKFQYQNVNYLSQFDAIVGLDHGDLTNYNYFLEINQNHLPYTITAIEFTFNEMSEIEYSLYAKVNEEYTWIVTEIDNYLMDEIFGSNWELTYGMFPDPEKFNKFKINITQIIENSTQWEINYSIWNWTYKDNNFTSTPEGNDLITFLKEPLNYTVPHNLSHIFPLLVPTPIFHYLNRSNLAESYSKIYSFDSGGDYVVLGDSTMSTTMINGDIIQFGRNAYYNKYGLLDWMNFYYTNQSWENNDKKSIFSIYNFYDSPKPSYIRVNESDIYDYGVYYSERNAPIIPLRDYSNLPNKFSIKIDFIGGFDPNLNRTFLSVNNSDVAFAIDPFSDEQNPDKYFLPENLTRYTILKRIILPAEVNWAYLDFIRSEIISIPNGFIISINIMNNILEFEYQYTLNGLLNIYSEYNNGKEYFSVRLNDFDYNIDDSDPIINIIKPQNNQTFGRNAPSYNISIIEPNLDKIWYSLDGGLTNVTITSLNGTINQTLWDSAPQGIITIRFFANDTNGYFSYKDVIVNKKISTNLNRELLIIFIFAAVIGSAIVVSAISFNYYQKEYKVKKREVPAILTKYDENNQINISTKSEEILNNLTNRKLLLDILGDQSFVFSKSIIDKIKLTTITNEFLRKVDILGFDENDKKEFLREMLALSPREREEIFSNIVSREGFTTERSSKDILNNLVDKDLIMQIFDENITDKRRNQLERIDLTTVSEKFLFKVDALGLKENNKINFIREMLALSPKEREEIINNILDRVANKNS